MVSDPGMVVRTELELRLAGFDELVDVPRGEEQGVLDACVVHLQEGGVLFADGHRAGGGGGEDLESLVHGLLEDIHVVPGVLGRLPGHAVGDEGHAAAFLLVQELHAHAQGVHHLHEILAQLRVVVVHVAAVEVSDLLFELRLLLGVAFQPAFETTAAVFRESAVLVDGEGRVQKGLRDAQRRGPVHDGSERAGERAHEVRIRKHDVAELGLRMVVLDAGGLDDVRDVDAGRAGDLAALAVQAVFEGLVEEVRVLEPEPFSVGTGLLGAGVARVHRHDRAVGRADGAFHALLEVMRAGGVFLQFHTFPPLMVSTAAKAVRMASPAAVP